MLDSLLKAERRRKKLINFSIDAALMVATPPLALLLRMGWTDFTTTILARSAPLLLILTVLGIILEPRFRIPSLKLSALDISAVFRIGHFALTLAVLGTILAVAFPLGAPRSLPAIFGAILFALMLGWRLAARSLVSWALRREGQTTNIAVYGAGSAGIQLIAALAQSGEFRVVAVVDDSPGLRDVFISGLRVQSPAALRKLAESGRIDRIVLAMPSISKRRQREIIASLQDLPCEVHSIPGYADLVNAGDLLTSIRAVSPDDVLGRDIVDLDIPEVAKAYAGRSVLISGAGGSIGSELCRQVLTCKPRRIVLFDISEFAIYTIDREIRPMAEDAGIDVVTALGSVCDRSRLRSVMAANRVDIVLHAAAYKHVPLVESNEVEGVKNNVFGTRTIAEVSRELSVERFILVSTDKAVRPSNVMGASKRLAEIAVQDLQAGGGGTKFAMVRFGNVLGSSGSVIPLFSGQIAAGGPITLTHPDVTRYFMTIPEAARLVLLAGSYATGGDLFVLDMGAPVKIADLARRMIRLSGLTVKDEDNPDGDIEIRVTGLRPGEKLYEELLIGGVVLPTPHPKILRAEESCPAPPEVEVMLDALQGAVDANAADSIRSQLVRWVEGYSGARPDCTEPVPAHRRTAPADGRRDGATARVAGQSRAAASSDRFAL